MTRAARTPFAPRALLLVDRPAVLRLLEATGTLEAAGVVVVCIDGTPRARVASLVRAFRSGQRSAVLYIHDAATVVFPFAIEPVATLVREQRSADPLVYVDLGLPPVGASARRFADPTLANDALIFELDRIPPATLARYCVDAANALIPTTR